MHASLLQVILELLAVVVVLGCAAVELWRTVNGR